MTKRMREPFHTLMWKASIGHNDSWSQVDPEVLEKFAELIVKECEKAIRAEIAVTDISGEVEKAWEMGMECGVYTIKKHFGVE